MLSQLDSGKGTCGVGALAVLKGIVSHPGERFHVHDIYPDMSVSGHVDQYTVLAGATLWLPQP